MKNHSRRRCYAVHSWFPASQLSHDVTTNDAYNMCAVTIGSAQDKSLVIAVYRAPRATQEDTQKLRDHTDQIAVRFNKIILVGDFNFSKMQWCANDVHSDTATELLLRLTLPERGLTEMATLPTRQSALLDLVFVTSHFFNINAQNMPPIANFDHNAQLFTFQVQITATFHNTVPIIQYDRVNYLTVLIGVQFSAIA